jgi:regulator of protease activity HflC (stomatin/prohibitin superfamily)
LAGNLMSQSPKVARQWERAVVLRLGRYVGLRGPGLFWIIPFVDSVTAWVDQRVITTSFAAEETLTSDTVPVNVDAVLFWMVYDPEKAALEVQNYPQAVSWAAQTALRDIIGRTSLTDLLRGRERIEEELQQLIDEQAQEYRHYEWHKINRRPCRKGAEQKRSEKSHYGNDVDSRGFNRG